MIIGMIKAHSILRRMCSQCSAGRGLLARPGCEDYREREVDEVEWQGGRVY